jgi:competence protein ComEA
MTGRLNILNGPFFGCCKSPAIDMPQIYRNVCLLRRADQWVVALLVALALAAIGGCWIVRGGWHNELIDADHSPRQTARFQVDINQAELPELLQLPGIGDALASRIIDSRKKDGPFIKLDDLQRVQGIGPKIMERLRPYLLPVKKEQSQKADKLI